MNRCKICVMPDTRPDTAFVHGVCSACISYQNRPNIDWAERKRMLDALLDMHRGRGPSPWDCIVPSSGGKDSTYQALKMIELGMKPLLVTASTCHLTPIGRANLGNLSKYADCFEITPNWSRRAKLNKLGLEMVGDISWPEHVAIFSTPFRVAADLGIKLIMYGENPQNEYGSPTEQAADALTMTSRWVQEFGGFNGLRVKDVAAMGYDMEFYELPPPEKLGGIEAHFLGQYLPWDSAENLQVAIQHGFTSTWPSPANWWSGENLDNAQTGLHDYMMWRKFGYGRGCAQISVDVRRGKIDREYAMRWVKEHDGKYPWHYAGIGLGDVLARIGITKERLDEIVSEFTNREIHPEIR